jgi:hypothetical protein
MKIIKCGAINMANMAFRLCQVYLKEKISEIIFILNFLYFCTHVSFCKIEYEY